MKHDPDDHARHMPQLAIGVVLVLASSRRRWQHWQRLHDSRRRRGSRILGLLAALALFAAPALFVGCAGPPEAIVPQLEAALRDGDRAAVEALLTEESRGLLDTMLDAPHPESRWPLGLHAPQEPSRVVAVTPSGAGVVTLEVEDAGGKSEWILRQEAGRWRVDLIASSSRRAVWGF